MFLHLLKIMELMICFVLFSIPTIITFLYINNHVQDAYMDEIFHIPQARQYCDGNFSKWDPMITTLPGLYLMSTGVLVPLSSALVSPTLQLCSTFWLRATNVFFSLANMYLIYNILKKLQNPLLDENGLKVVLSTLALSSFPVLYFFTFLYYTDAGSIFMVLLMYLFNLRGNHLTAAAFGLGAILFRQTNVIWVVFVTCLVVRKELISWLREVYEKKSDGVLFSDLSDWELLKLCVKILFKFATTKPNRDNLIALIVKIVKQVWGYVAVGVMFIGFIVVNGGIVVGDRSQHTACLNFPQIFYFLVMANFFALFHLTSPSKIWQFLKFCWEKKIIVVSFLIVSFLIVKYFTYEHKYLLSDNRHYPFYVWRKLYKRHEYVPYALIPIYLYCSWAFWTALQNQDVIWKIIFIICLIASTVPQKLLEYRYFILPYLIYRLNMRYVTFVGLFHEFLLYLAINIATVYLFVEKPFQWAHEKGLQRFMW